MLQPLFAMEAAQGGPVLRARSFIRGILVFSILFALSVLGCKRSVRVAANGVDDVDQQERTEHCAAAKPQQEGGGKKVDHHPAHQKIDASHQQRADKVAQTHQQGSFENAEGRVLKRASSGNAYSKTTA